MPKENLNKSQFCLLKMLIGKLGCVPKTGRESGKKPQSCRHKRLIIHAPRLLATVVSRIKSRCQQFSAVPSFPLLPLKTEGGNGALGNLKQTYNTRTMILAVGSTIRAVKALKAGCSRDGN